MRINAARVDWGILKVIVVLLKLRPRDRHSTSTRRAAQLNTLSTFPLIQNIVLITGSYFSKLDSERDYFVRYKWTLHNFFTGGKFSK